MGSGLSPTFDVGGIPCAILLDSGIVEGEPDGVPEATVLLKCAYAERFNLRRKLVGELIWAGGSSFVRIGGLPYPPSPNLFCLDVPQIVPAPGAQPSTLPNGWLEWDQAAVTARFGVPPYDAASGEYWSLELGTTGEFITLPDTTWTFVGGGNPVGSELARPMSQTQIQYTAHRLPFIPQDEIDSLTSTLNDAPYRVGRRVYPTGTLLFVGGNTSWRQTTDGLEYDVSYSLIKRPVDWNYFWNPLTYSFDQVSSDGTTGGFMPFSYADFTILPV